MLSDLRVELSTRLLRVSSPEDMFVGVVEVCVLVRLAHWQTTMPPQQPTAALTIALHYGSPGAREADYFFVILPRLTTLTTGRLSSKMLFSFFFL